MRSRLAAFVTTFLVLCACGAQASEQDCGSLDNSYGPFDYRTHRNRLGIVEKFHFTAKVESLAGGVSGSLGGDLDYTLRASPNHHRALIALMRLAERTKLPQQVGLPRPVECYFDRAFRFQRDDPIPRMIYARYLAAGKREDDAKKQLAMVAEQAADNPFTHYNTGLIYAELKDYPRALEQAHKAMALGHTATELRDQLRKAGHWQEPAPVPAAPASGAAK